MFKVKNCRRDGKRQRQSIEHHAKPQPPAEPRILIFLTDIKNRLLCIGGNIADSDIFNTDQQGRHRVILSRATAQNNLRKLLRVWQWVQY
jgi:hypothetical protein